MLFLSSISVRIQIGEMVIIEKSNSPNGFSIIEETIFPFNKETTALDEPQDGQGTFVSDFIMQTFGEYP